MSPLKHISFYLNTIWEMPPLTFWIYFT